MADHRHQRHVFVAIGVEVAALQVDAVVFGEPLCRIGFPGAPDDRPLDVARSAGRPVDFEVIAQQPADPERTGDRFGVDGQCRRAQRDGVAASLVRGDDLAHERDRRGTRCG